MNKTGVIIGAVVLLAVAGGAYALTKGKDEPTQSNTTTTQTSTETEHSHADGESADHDHAVETSTITYTDDGFNPASIKVKAGSTVTVKNDSSKVLQFSSDPHPDHTNNPDLNLNNVSPGQSTTFTASEAGTYGFHNHLNEDHTGTLIVE